MLFKPRAWKISSRLIFLLLFFPATGGTTFQCPLPEDDYKKIFGNDWDKAEEFVKDNEEWMKRLSEILDISYPEAVSVVFPELVRYSALRDRIEVALLQTLYINLGEEYADFSIGYLQMKPSFAAAVHGNSHLLRGKLKNQFRKSKETDNPREFRKTIVEDMQKPRMQFIYLAAFIKICESRFSLSDLDEEQRIGFLSTAYNYSFLKSQDQINAMTGSRYFTTGTDNDRYFSYSDISLYWYRLHR
ncbi:MAG: hypothetical protein RBS38_04490 [Bacteroidales bacterium]|jgi:hypothetical protein|nr:hypothetical protein [Bacteroidales bacterium]